MAFIFKKNKIEGIIAYLGLESFWESCSHDEQVVLTRYHRSALGGTLYSSPIEGKIEHSNRTALQYLYSKISNATSENKFTFANKIIKYAEYHCYDTGKLIDKHFYLQTVAECYYKQQEINENALALCIEYCKRDMELFPKYRAPLKREMSVFPRIRTFQRLAMIYEKQGQIEEAIGVCRLAIKYKLQDSTKGGYEGRIKRLEKKLNK